MKLKLFSMTMGSLLLLTSSFAMAAKADSVNGLRIWSVKDKGAGVYNVHGAGQKGRIKPKKDAVRFLWGEKKYYVKGDGVHFTLRAEDGQQRFAAKVGQKKIRLFRGNATTSFMTLKIKAANHIKVKMGETHIGKIKFYADSNTVKAKDLSNAKICKTSADGLRWWPGICLARDLSADDQALLIALLLAAQK